jgi:uncharacterized SAM-binding protein YcdF (DUF218 family)
MNSATNIPVEVNRTRRNAGWMRVLLCVVFVCAGLLFTGFLLFSGLIADGPSGDPPEADAIVALTGGEARIPEAIRLLQLGKGERLLISGVNPVTTRQELALLTPESQSWFRCCIDVDRVARDTIGNANETRAWIEKRGFKSLIVVTASYHMPRSLAELRRALPDTVLIAYPVKPSNLRVDAWWAYKGTLKLLAMEYLKFMPAFGRCVLSQVSLNRGVYGGAQQCLTLPVSG